MKDFDNEIRCLKTRIMVYTKKVRDRVRKYFLLLLHGVVHMVKLSFGLAHNILLIIYSCRKIRKLSSQAVSCQNKLEKQSNCKMALYFLICKMIFNLFLLLQLRKGFNKPREESYKTFLAQLTQISMLVPHKLMFGNFPILLRIMPKKF